MSQIGLIPFYRAVDTNGNPLANARLYTFLTGTLAPQAVYTTEALSVSHGAYVQADGNGLFPAFYPDPTLTYRYQLRISPYSDAVTGCDADPVASLTSSAVTFLQTGTGAVARTAQAKLRETISVDDFGAVGDGVANDYAAIVAAQTALVALGGGELLFTLGKTYLVNTPITMASGVTYKGTGASGIDMIHSTSGARIIAGTGGIFRNSASTIHEVNVENLFLHSPAGGGHICDWSSAGDISIIKFIGVTAVQENTDKHIIKGTAAGGVFSIFWLDSWYQYATGNTVSPFYFYSPTVNSIQFDTFWSTCTTAATSGVPSIHIESTNVAGPAINCIVRAGEIENPGGGSVKMLSVANSGVEACTVYDLGVTPNQIQFEIGKGASGPPSNNCWIEGVRSNVGTTLKPDCKIDCSVSGQAGFLVDNCTFTYIDGGSVTPTPGILIHAGDITNFQNIAYTRLGATAALDIHFGTSDGSSKSYTIWNGYSGNAQGYLNFYQNGAYKWAFSPSGNFQVGGSLGSPNVTLTNSGGVVANSYVRVPLCAVADLPAAGTAGSGARATVSDANATTFNSVVAGGGANKVPVFSDGTDWKIG